MGDQGQHEAATKTQQHPREPPHGSPSSPSQDARLADHSSDTGHAKQHVGTQGESSASRSSGSPLASSMETSAAGPSRKRPRRDEDAAGRGKRMFGMLNATLSRAKQDSEKDKDRAKRRASIEARQQQRLEREREATEAIQSVTRILRRACEQELAIVEELLAGEAANRSHRAQKRRLASFLVTSSPIALAQGKEMQERARQSRDSRRRPTLGPASVLGMRPQTVVCPGVPAALHPSPGLPQRTKQWALYYLPRKLTMEQEDTLDDQEDKVDTDIEEADAEWEATRQALQAELEECRRKIEELVEEKRKAAAQQESTSGPRNGRLSPIVAGRGSDYKEDDRAGSAAGRSPRGTRSVAPDEMPPAGSGVDSSEPEANTKPSDATEDSSGRLADTSMDADLTAPPRPKKTTEVLPGEAGATAAAVAKDMQDAEMKQQSPAATEDTTAQVRS